MPYIITITGLTEVRKMLSGADFAGAMSAATLGIAQGIKEKTAPYPPQTIANSPSNPMGRWYVRGTGGFERKADGTVVQTSSSQDMIHKWQTQKRGRMSHLLQNIATYSRYLHSAADQVGWAGQRGWKTDQWGIEQVVDQGIAKRIIVAAIMGAFRKAKGR